MRCWGTDRNGRAQRESPGLTPSGVHCDFARFLLLYSVLQRDVHGPQGHGGQGLRRIWPVRPACGMVIDAVG